MGAARLRRLRRPRVPRRGPALLRPRTALGRCPRPGMGRRGSRSRCGGLTRRTLAPIEVESSPPEESEGLAGDADAGLRLTEQGLLALLEHASDVITVLDAQGRVVYSSPAGKRMLGYAPGFWMGHNVFELVHPDDAPRVIEVFARALGTPGLTDPVQFRMRHADGAWRYVEAVGNNLLHDPVVHGMVVTTRDVTDRHEAEVAMRVSEARFTMSGSW